MKRRYFRDSCASLSTAKQGQGTLPHFTSGLIGKRYRQNAGGIDATLDQLCYSVGDDPCLACASACQNQQGPLECMHGFALGRIKIGHGPPYGHCSSESSELHVIDRINKSKLTTLTQVLVML
jgi:hypothetical protein